MTSWRRASLIPLAAAVLAALPVLAAEPVYPPGSRIGLVPPPNMKPAPGMSGFRDPATGAAILTLEMPAAAFPSLATGFTDEALKTQGFTLQAREEPKVGAGPGILVSGQQAEGDRTVLKTVLLAADPSMTALVIGQLPPNASPSAQTEMRNAFKTVAFRPPLSMDDQLAALPFRVVDTAGFRPVRAMAGNSLMLTIGDKDQVVGAEQPVVIVAQSFAPAPPPDQRDAFARALLAGNTLLKDIVAERSQNFRQGGSEWHEIVAKAKDGTAEQPVLVMQTIRFDPGSYTRMIGIAKLDARDDMLPRFRRLVDTLAFE